MIQSFPPAQTMRSGATLSVSPTVASGAERFVRRSTRVSTRSRWFMTQAVVPEKAMSAGPLPAGTWATTLFVFGFTRTTFAPWSSATQTEPPPIQML